MFRFHRALHVPASYIFATFTVGWDFLFRKYKYQFMARWSGEFWEGLWKDITF